MTETEVLIIGAGAAGLAAARHLARCGRQVVVLEARSRAGGRIDTFEAPGFSGPTEAGAEFLHGEVLHTTALLQEAGIVSHPTGGTTFEVEDGQVRESDEFIKDMGLLLEKLHALPHDLPLAEFLTQYFPEANHRSLRESATRFAEGYDAADARRASSFALRDEWSGGGAEDSPRPEGGYGRLVAMLAAETQEAGGIIRLNAAAQQIRWQPNQLEVQCENGHIYRAQQAIITLPLGVLQSEAGSPGHVAFAPDLPEYRAAALALGFGPVIKVLLEFEHSFWNQHTADLTQPMPDMGFLFSDAPVPTWWSQLPDPRPLLTGWLAGPAAAQLRGASEEALLALALDSLAYLFGSSPAYLRTLLRAHRIVNWGADPRAHGAYAYATVGAAAARTVLTQPVSNTLYFAGEALHGGLNMGTVEAALDSGLGAARQLVATRNTAPGSSS